MRYLKLIGTVLIVGLYCTSFALPVLSDPRDPNATTYGASVFVASFGLLFHLPEWQPGWLANPWLWIGVYLLQREKWISASFLGLVGLILGIQIGQWANGRGECGAVLGLDIGHYVWLASFGMLVLAGLVGCLAKAIMQRSSVREENPQATET